MNNLLDCGLSRQELIKSYELMLTGRRLDERMWQLTRIGKSTFIISGQGCEVAQVAMAWPLITQKIISFHTIEI